MSRAEPTHRDLPPAIRRLHAVSGLDAATLLLLEQAARKKVRFPIRHDIAAEGSKAPAAMLILDGWAARVRYVSEGWRQIVSVMLPGDLIGNCGYDGALASSSITALTEVVACDLPEEPSPDLARAFAVSRALDEAHLSAQVVRLGRLDAADRIIDFLLELNERLVLAGLSTGSTFDFPLTQEMVADALGLTSVHVNRMLQQARRSGDLVWTGRRIRLLEPKRAAYALGRTPTAVV